jgi:hypothetical protein
MLLLLDLTRHKCPKQRGISKKKPAHRHKLGTLALLDLTGTNVQNKRESAEKTSTYTQAPYSGIWAPALPFFSVSAVYLAWHNPIRPPDFPLLPVVPPAAKPTAPQFLSLPKKPSQIQIP